MTSVEEPDWPTHCEHCGTELQPAVVGVMPGGDEQLDTVVAQDYCPNPDCPVKTADPAAAADPFEGASLDQTAEGRQRSLGGDNGGA